MSNDLPQSLYSQTPPPQPPQNASGAPVSGFLEAHGTVVLLYCLLLVLYGLAAFFALYCKIDGKEVFAYFSGVATGTFNALAIAMRVTNGK